jgi:hypothetical protein
LSPHRIAQTKCAIARLADFEFEPESPWWMVQLQPRHSGRNHQSRNGASPISTS